MDVTLYKVNVILYYYIIQRFLYVSISVIDACALTNDTFDPDEKCLNFGVCNNTGIPYDYVCVCQAGYIGDRCETGEYTCVIVRVYRR